MQKPGQSRRSRRKKPDRKEIFADFKESRERRTSAVIADFKRRDGIQRDVHVGRALVKSQRDEDDVAEFENEPADQAAKSKTRDRSGGRAGQTASASSGRRLVAETMLTPPGPSPTQIDQAAVVASALSAHTTEVVSVTELDQTRAEDRSPKLSSTSSANELGGDSPASLSVRNASKGRPSLSRGKPSRTSARAVTSSVSFPPLATAADDQQSKTGQHSASKPSRQADTSGETLDGRSFEHARVGLGTSASAERRSQSPEDGQARPATADAHTAGATDASDVLLDRGSDNSRVSDLRPYRSKIVAHSRRDGDADALTESLTIVDEPPTRQTRSRRKLGGASSPLQTADAPRGEGREGSPGVSPRTDPVRHSRAAADSDPPPLVTPQHRSADADDDSRGIEKSEADDAVEVVIGDDNDDQADEVANDGNCKYCGDQEKLHFAGSEEY